MLEHPVVTKLNSTGEVTAETLCGIDAMGDDIVAGDYIIEFDGEIILESNIIDYLVDILGAKKKVAGEED